jgi:flagellar hook-associated protein 3 FlgL
MRITNKIMQNNSLYNINNNKVSEDQLNTMMSTGKKITRPSDDPVIAIRALRLRSNVTQLSQYYEKNAKDAESWLEVTADALSTITDVLTDAVKQVTKGANKDLTLDDLSIIVTQLDALSKEYYATGNVDYAGRYVFTGYRTDTPLTFETATTASYADINDEFKAGDVSDSSRVVGKHNLDNATVMDDNYVPTLQSDIVEQTVGRLRLSYDNLDYAEGDGKNATLKYREKLEQPATSSITNTWDAVNLTFKDLNGRTRYASIPVNTNLTDYSIKSEGIVYKAQLNRDGSIDVTGSDPVLGKEYKVKVGADGTVKDMSMEVDSAIASIETKQVSTVTYTPYFGSNPISVEVPLLPAIDQTYTINLDKEGFTAVVNSDGTYTIRNNVATINDDGSYSNQIIQMTDNGSIHASYHETTVEIGADKIIYNTSSAAEIDGAYNDLVERTDGALAYMNAATGEVLLNRTLKDKLSTLPDIINSRTIDIIYDKKEWVNGDIRPENLFGCTYTDRSGQTIYYNQGSSDHDIAYDVGFSQSVVVNTMADAVFTTNVKRDVSDLSSRLDELQQMATTLKTLKIKLESTGDETKKAKIENDIASAQKAYDFMREEIQKDFEHKITSIQKSLDIANIAVTDNGTRSKRLDLISTRLMSQTTTFKALQSENEDIDLAEAATKLTTAQVTYEASLMATGKISQTSLLNYL